MHSLSTYDLGESIYPNILQLYILYTNPICMYSEIRFENTHLFPLSILLTKIMVYVVLSSNRFVILLNE